MSDTKSIEMFAFCKDRDAARDCFVEVLGQSEKTSKCDAVIQNFVPDVFVSLSSSKEQLQNQVVLA